MLTKSEQAKFNRILEQESLELFRGRLLTPEEEREMDRKHGMTLVQARRKNPNPTAIEAYLLGDRLGAAWETGNVCMTNRTIREIRISCNQYPEGSDGSDILRCFQTFADNYNYRSSEQLLVDWCVFHYQNHRHVVYGQTYNDHFQLVGHLLDKEILSLETLYWKSKERNSCENSCLALVYPIVFMARTVGENPLEMVQDFTRLTHAHPKAIVAAVQLFRIFWKKEAASVIAKELKIEGISQKELINLYPSNVSANATLAHALHAALQGSKDNVIVSAINVGGDVNSVLATALLIHHVINE